MIWLKEGADKDEFVSLLIHQTFLSWADKSLSIFSFSGE